MKAGRNDPCSCGSGKKYKYCCYAKVTLPARQKNCSPAQSEIKQLFALFKDGRYEELEVIALELVERHPNSGLAWKMLGNAQRFLKKEPLPALFRAVELLPDDIEALTNLGFGLVIVGRHEEAAVHLIKAINIKPDDAIAYSVLGVALQCQLRHDEAIASFEKALSFKYQTLELLNNLCISLTAVERLDDAVPILRKAIEIDPNDVRAYKTLATALMHLGDLDGAVACHLQALEFRPNDALARANFGATLHTLGRYVEAIQCYEIALLLDPTYEAAIYNRGYSYLALGRLAQGWVDYDYRPSRLELRHPELPFWAGEDLSGKSVLIWGEQGIGDEIRIAGMFAEVVERSSRCVIECHIKLLPLFARTFPRALVVVKTNPPHPDTLDKMDYQCAAGSLARWLRPTIESFPQRESYLTPDPQRVQYWRDLFGKLGPGPKIGFCWRSKVNVGSRKLYYTTLDLWEPIFTLPGVHFVNLQYDQCDEELNAARKQFGIPLYEFPEVDMLNDLDETAAFTQALDLVISSPTAPSIMAAALGIPSWVIGYDRGWQALGTDYMPWFPTMRVFYRQSDQSRSDIIAAIAKLLESALGLEPLEEDQINSG